MFAKRIANECNKNRDKKILLIDAPCGNGETAYYLAKKTNAIVKAYDISEGSISFAKTNYQVSNLSFYKKDIHGVVEENDSIDVFCIINSLFLLPHPEDLLVKLRSKLKNDGELYIIVPNISGQNFKRFQIINSSVNSFLLRPEEFNSYFLKLGYKVLFFKPIAYTSWFARKDAMLLRSGSGVYLNSISFFKEKLNIGHGNYFLIKLIKDNQG
ncbi:MAG: methyltransferase domain-containing protein [Bacteroidetes bacterium]|nr:methyltransferase domain-containing protein [Bacteroidota bacterium]